MIKLYSIILLLSLSMIIQSFTLQNDNHLNEKIQKYNNSNIKDKNDLQRKINIILNRKIPSLPEKLSIGYPGDFHCGEDIFKAVQMGLNVIIWFSTDMSTDPKTGKAYFPKRLNYSEVAKMNKKIKDAGYDIINLLSIGGWNYPHPDTSHSAEEYFNAFIEFNAEIMSEKDDFYGFDGLDWDIEGNTDKSSKDNYFTIEQLNLMGKFSQLLKDQGYIISMAPPESYTDYKIEDFSLSLQFCHKEWKDIVPDYLYHGKNAYSYLLVKYSKSIIKQIDTFDFISVQLYESYSHALYRLRYEKEAFPIILENIVRKYDEGYWVDFSQEPLTGLNKTLIKIDRTKLVIGLANGWATGKAMFLKEDQIIQSYEYLKLKGLDLKGFMFWCIMEEGRVPIDDPTGNPFYMAEIINKMFHIRN